MELRSDREQTNDANRVELLIDGVILDNSPKVEVKNSSLRKILLGILIGAIVGLLIIGVIAVALIFAYGTAGVGPLVLGLFGGIGAIATWSSVAAIGATFVGLCSSIGGFIGNWLSSSSQEIGDENQSLVEQKNTQGSTNNMLGELGGKTHQNEIQPIHLVVEKQDSSEEEQTIESINEAFAIKMREKQRIGTFSTERIVGLLRIATYIEKKEKVIEKEKGLNLLVESVANIGECSSDKDIEYRQDITDYVSAIRKAMESLEKNESIEQEPERTNTI